MKKISVIIPCYNMAQYLDRCMTSVVRQTIGMDALEIICIDDASTDDTWECLKKWEQLFPENIVLIHSDVNGKPGMARNIGLRYVSADYIAFVDADDWLEKDYLEKLYRPVETYQCDVVACGAILDSSDQLTYFSERERDAGSEEYFSAAAKDVKKLLFRYRILGETVWGKVIRRGLFRERKMVFPEGLFYEDVYWMPQLYMYAAGVYVMGEKLYHHYWNPDSVVFSRNTDHHRDALTIQSMKWESYIKRNFLKKFRKELEWDSLHDAIGITNMIVARYDRPPFSFFEAERRFMKEHVPDYRGNPYIADLKEFPRFLLELLYSDIDEAGFYQVAAKLKQSYDQIPL